MKQDAELFKYRKCEEIGGFILVASLQIMPVL